jgi:hypothetical protein
MGAMDYTLFAGLLRPLPAEIPLIAEHLVPAQFGDARRKLVAPE